MQLGYIFPKYVNQEQWTVKLVIEHRGRSIRNFANMILSLYKFLTYVTLLS